MLLRFGPLAAILLLCLPVLAGLAGTLLPAFGYLPALGGHELTHAPFEMLAAQPGLARSAWLSFFVGLTSTALALLLVAGFVAAWHGTRAFSAIQHMVSPLLAVPHAAAAFGFAFLIAPSGFLARVFSPWLTGWDRPPDILLVNDAAGLSLIAGLAAKEVPFLLLVTLAALPQVPARMSTMVTGSLGYGRLAGFFHTVWPQLYRQIRLAVFAVLAYGTANVDMAIILGPSTPQLLPVRLVAWMNDPDLTRRFMACAGACLQIAVTAAALGVWIGMEKAGAFILANLRSSGRRFAHDRPLRVALSGAMAGSAAAIFGGLVLLVLWSFSGLWQFPSALPSGLTLRGWIQALPGIATPLATTFIIAFTATVLSLAIVLACLEQERRTGRSGGERAMWLVYLPLVVPQIGFLFGLQMLLLTLRADATWPAVILAHMVFVLPYVFLSLSSPWRAFDTRYDAVAASLGRSPAGVFWRIRMPMLLRAILAAAAVGFAVSVGQYLPTLLVGAGRFPTITTEAVALAAGGNRRVIGIYAVLQMVLPFAGFMLASAIPALLFSGRRAIRGA